MGPISDTMGPIYGGVYDAVIGYGDSCFACVWLWRGGSGKMFQGEDLPAQSWGLPKQADCDPAGGVQAPAQGGQGQAGSASPRKDNRAGPGLGC